MYLESLGSLGQGLHVSWEVPTIGSFNNSILQSSKKGKGTLILSHGKRKIQGVMVCPHTYVGRLQGQHPLLTELRWWWWGSGQLQQT